MFKGRVKRSFRFCLSIVVMLLTFSSISFAESEAFVYFKGMDLYKYSLKDRKPMLLYQGVRIKDENDIYGGHTDYRLLEDLVRVSRDGTRVLFPVEYDVENNTCVMYYSDSRSGDGKAKKMADGVKWVSISDDGKVVYYLDKENGSYRFDFKKSTKLSEGVDPDRIVLSKDGQKIIYRVGQQILMKEASKPLIRVTDRGYLITVGEEGKTIYYESDGIYQKREGGPAKKILEEDLARVEILSVSDSGKIYYSMSDHEAQKDDLEGGDITKYIEDDLSAVDQKILKNHKALLNKPKRKDRDSEADHLDALEKYENTIEEERYQINMDQAYRDLLKEPPWDIYRKDIGYFDGRSGRMIFEKLDPTRSYIPVEMTKGHQQTKAEDLCVFSSYQDIKEEKVKFSSIINDIPIGNIRETVINKISKSYLAIGGKVVPLDIKDPVYFFLTRDKKQLFAISYNSEKYLNGKMGGDLYLMTIDGENVSKPQLYDQDVSLRRILELQDGGIFYHKKLDGRYIPCIDKKQLPIPSKASAFNTILRDDGQTIDLQIRKEGSTMVDYYRYRSGKLEKLFSNYDSYFILGDRLLGLQEVEDDLYDIYLLGKEGKTLIDKKVSHAY